MSKVIYEVVLSPDGKHAVSVKSDDAVLLKDALPLAKKIQEGLLQVDRTDASSPASQVQPASQSEQLQQPESPLCGVHSTPMVSMQGKKGSFWSCHKKNPDGSWCNFRPGRTRAGTSRPDYRYPTA
jgi:hypothetical protein